MAMLCMYVLYVFVSVSVHVQYLRVYTVFSQGDGHHSQAYIQFIYTCILG